MKDKNILITGASSGIGKATAIKLDEMGANCVMIARDEDKLLRVRDGMRNPKNHIVIPCDLMKLENCSDIFSRLKMQGIILDGMVHCAGFTSVTPLRTFNVQQAQDLFQIHYFAFMELVKQYAKKGASNGGSVVGISAMNAHVPQKCMSAYASAKSAVEAACRSLAVELAEKSIRINSVVVGGISGGMGKEIHDVIQSVGSTYENPTNRQLLGMGAPENIADIIVFLLCDKSAFITGRELYADGGLF